MKTFHKILLLILLPAITGTCDITAPDGPDPDPTELTPMGTLDIAFTYRIQGIPAARMRKVELCLARTADDLYRGTFFTCCNVSEAVTHYQFYLPPGEYFYFASIICLCSDDSCKFSGFPGHNGLLQDGGKVEVFDGQITKYTTQFH